MHGASARADAGQEHGRRGRLGLPNGQLRPDHGVYHMREAGMKMRNHNRWFRPRNRKRRSLILFIPVRVEPIQENELEHTDIFTEISNFVESFCITFSILLLITCFIIISICIIYAILEKIVLLD